MNHLEKFLFSVFPPNISRPTNPEKTNKSEIQSSIEDVELKKLFQETDGKKKDGGKSTGSEEESLSRCWIWLQVGAKNLKIPDVPWTQHQVYGGSISFSSTAELDIKTSHILHQGLKSSDLKSFDCRSVDQSIDPMIEHSTVLKRI